MCYFCLFCVEIHLCWDLVKDWDDTYRPQSLFHKPVAHEIINTTVILWYWTSFRYLQEWLLVLILTKLEEQVGVQCSRQYQTKVDCSDCKRKREWKGLVRREIKRTRKKANWKQNPDPDVQAAKDKGNQDPHCHLVLWVRKKRRKKKKWWADVKGQVWHCDRGKNNQKENCYKKNTLKEKCQVPAQL